MKSKENIYYSNNEISSFFTSRNKANDQAYHSLKQSKVGITPPRENIRLTQQEEGSSSSHNSSYDVKLLSKVRSKNHFEQNDAIKKIKLPKVPSTIQPIKTKVVAKNESQLFFLQKTNSHVGRRMVTFREERKIERAGENQTIKIERTQLSLFDKQSFKNKLNGMKDVNSQAVNGQMHHLLEIDQSQYEVQEIFKTIADIEQPGMEEPDEIDKYYIKLKKEKEEKERKRAKRFGLIKGAKHFGLMPIIQNKRVNRQQVYQFLISRYNRPEMVDKIIECFNFNLNPIGFKAYCQTIQKYLFKTFDEKLRLAFDLYDHNSDGFICPNDTLEGIKHLKQYDYLMNNDIQSISNFFQKKSDQQQSSEQEKDLKYIESQRQYKSQIKYLEMTESICSDIRQQAVKKKNNFKLDLSNVKAQASSRNPIFELSMINQSSGRESKVDSQKENPYQSVSHQSHAIQQNLTNPYLEINHSQRSRGDESNRSFLKFCAQNYDSKEEVSSFDDGNQDNQTERLKQGIQQTIRVNSNSRIQNAIIENQIMEKQNQTVFDIKDAFAKYIKSRIKVEDQMNFEDFSKLKFQYGFPVILLDLIFTLTGQLMNENQNYSSSKDIGKVQSVKQRNSLSKAKTSQVTQQQSRAQSSLRSLLKSQVNQKPHIPLNQYVSEDIQNPYFSSWKYSNEGVQKAIAFIGSHPVEDREKFQISDEKLTQFAKNFMQKHQK